MNPHFFTAPFYFAFIWFRVSPWGVLPLDCVRKRFSGFCRFYGFCGFYGFSGEGAAHKNMEAPRSINRAMPEDGISVTSH